MKIKVEENTLYVYCQICQEWLELIDLLKIGNGVHCLICKEHLGYEHDIPDNFKIIRGWESL